MVNARDERTVQGSIFLILASQSLGGGRLYSVDLM